jgi:TolB-like protein/DNA-binding winged helix-turn-helix (wHTH) protein
MDETTAPTHVLRFGVFEVDLRTGELRKQGLKIKLHGQPMEVLGMLLEHPGELVTREEIQKRLWPANTFIDFEHSLNTAIKKLREVLGDDADNPRFIETLPRRGYRFVYPVEAARRAVWEEETLQRSVSTSASAVGAGLAPPSGAQEAEPLHEAVASAVGAVREPPLRKRWVLAATGVVLATVATLIALNVAGLRDRMTSFVGARHGVPVPKIESIAVLPLENLSGDPEQEYFADGMTEALITNLGKIRALRVISRTTAMHFKGTKQKLPEIARELNVDAVVEGSVLRSGNRVRVTANLLHAPTDRHLWANTYESELQDVLVLQGEVARAIAEEVRIKLTPDEQVRLTPTRPVNPEAYEALIRGDFCGRKLTGEGIAKAVEYYQLAVERDPNYALAYARLGAAYLGGLITGHIAPEEAIPKSNGALLKAIQIDETLAEAHAMLGMLKHNEWDWQGAEDELRRAVELDPNDASARLAYGDYLVIIGRADEGIEQCRRGVELDPLSRDTLARIYVAARRYGDAIVEIQKELEITPSPYATRLWLVPAYYFVGMKEEALAECRRLEGLNAGTDVWRGAFCGFVYGALGKRQRAERVLAEVMSSQPYADPVCVASVYVGMGERDQAIKWLNKGFEEHAASMDSLKVIPFFDNLRSDPRFQDLLRRMNFPPESAGTPR